ncbi:hypothetical protein [Saccharopolyspora spinosa]|uniref:Uncharacterized protein n=1 Tax=Saccharopolyspora spinosa TaxID=60894 RepID=A0A2N3Y6J4_SACSN|nr:hypothetical protein [Saccharopolyspora spinosa]PKW18549.1 hypothetical protein A8926_6644 [Saccharopolyspora spinosa]
MIKRNLTIPADRKVVSNPFGSRTPETYGKDFKSWKWDENPKIPLSRHHIISFPTLRLFWNDLVANGHKNHTQELLDSMKNHLDRYGQFVAGFNKAELENLITNWHDYEHDPNASNQLPGLPELGRMFCWLPTLVFVGPSNRSEDPAGDNNDGRVEFETHCNGVLQPSEDPLMEEVDRNQALLYIDFYRKAAKETEDYSRDYARFAVRALTRLNEKRFEFWPLHTDGWLCYKTAGKYKFRIEKTRPPETTTESEALSTSEEPSMEIDRVPINFSLLDQDSETGQKYYEGRATGITLPGILAWCRDAGFKNASVPDALSSVKISSLVVGVWTAPEYTHWTFTVNTEFEVGGNNVSAMLSLDCHRTNTGPKYAFTLRTTVGVGPSGDQMWFSGEVRKNLTGDWMLSASWSAVGTTTTMSVLTAARALGVAIPDDLTLPVLSEPVTGAALVYDFGKSGLAATIRVGDNQIAMATLPS